MTTRPCPGCYATIDISWNKCGSCNQPLYFYGKSTGNANSEALKLAIIERQTRIWPNNATNTKPNLKHKSNSPPKKDDSNNGFLKLVVGGAIVVALGPIIGF